MYYTNFTGLEKLTDFPKVRQKSLDPNWVSRWVSPKVGEGWRSEDGQILPKETRTRSGMRPGPSLELDAVRAVPSCCLGQCGGGNAELTAGTRPPQVSGCVPTRVCESGSENREPPGSDWLGGFCPLVLVQPPALVESSLPSIPLLPPHLHTGVHSLQGHVEVFLLDLRGKQKEKACGGKEMCVRQCSGAPVSLWLPC